MLENGSAGDDEEGEEEALARELDAALGTDDLARLQQVARPCLIPSHLSPSRPAARRRFCHMQGLQVGRDCSCCFLLLLRALLARHGQA